MGGVSRRPEEPWPALLTLCLTQLTSWGILYYAFPVMVVDVAAQTGWSTGMAMTGFSAGAVVSAVTGVAVGRWVDRFGPRVVMTSGAVLGVVGLLAVAAAPTLPSFFAPRALVGLAQAGTLYPPAFIAVTRWFGPARRVRALTSVTLAGGLSSTVFAPLTAALVADMGWRQTLAVLALLLAVLTVPAHALLLTPAWHPAGGRPDPDPADAAHAREVVRSRPFLLLAAGLGLGALGLYAATVNLVPLLTGRGMSTQLAAWGLGLVGAGQLLGRLGYGWLARRSSVAGRTSGILLLGGLSVGLLGLLGGPVPLLLVVGTLAGALRGALTLVQATAVAERWGTQAFGRVTGVFGAPVTVAIAVAPGAGAVLAGAVGGFPRAVLLLALVTLAGALLVTASRTGAVPTGADRVDGTEGPVRGSR